MRLLKELRLGEEPPMIVICDMASIRITKNLAHHDMTRHVEIDRHFIWEKTDSGLIEVCSY